MNPRKEYWRAYYLRNRERIRARAKRRWAADVIYREQQREWTRRYRTRNQLEIKVARGLAVPIPKARAILAVEAQRGAAL